MLSIAVLEDNEIVAEELIRYLARPGRSVAGYGTAAALLAHMHSSPPDIAIVDLGLPDMDGLDVVRRLRQISPDMGVIILTARSHRHDRSHGYEAGSDVFLSKPTNVRELDAVVQNLADRVLRLKQEKDPFDYVLQRGAMRIRLASSPWVTLTAAEMRVLECLAQAPSQELSNEALLLALEQHSRKAHETSPEQARSNLAVQISRLRSKMGQQSGQLIASVRGVGYHLTAKIRISD